MAQLTTTTKLRRVPVEAGTAPRVAAPPREARTFWHGIALDELGQALAQTHHATVVWKRLASCVSEALEDQAIAYAQRQGPQFLILADDGLHDELRKAIAKNDAKCPFLAAPGICVPALIPTLRDDEARSLYEFIEHYWGWTLDGDNEPYAYMMVFGSEEGMPSPLAQNAAIVSQFVSWHLSSEKRRRQLISDLSAETQGLRITPAAALHRRLDLWVRKDDGAK